jgi:ABC-type multidrug transport system ATPase subunit
MEYPLSQVRPDADFGTSIDKVSAQVRRLSVVLSRNGTHPLTPAGVARKLKARLSLRSPITAEDHHPPQQEKHLLLDTVDADFLPGAITAIIGASGSGKTTLLNAVAGRLPGGTSVTEGTVRWNRNNGGLDRNDVRLAYLTQHDVLIPTLTVRETLTYAASFRLPALTTSSARRQIVQDVIEELHLGRCADTRIGDSWKRGCSGGEKRRVSIGVQLLSNPSLLLLDEPTTGLDAASALSVVRTLRQLAARGRTVVATLHQPRMEIWSLVENVVVLAPRGMPVYSGPVSGSLPWLEAQGFSRPDFVNAADFIIDVTAVDGRSAEAERLCGSRVRHLQAAWREEARRRFPLLTVDEPMEGSVSIGDRSRKARRTLFLRRLCALTSRTAKITYRDRLGMTASVMEAILVGLTVGYMFLHLGRDQAGIRARQGCLYVAASLQGYLILIFETYRLSSDMPVFEAEAAERCVSPDTFLLSRRLARLPTEDIPVPLILSCLVYFMAGFDSAADGFGTFLAVTIANHYVAILCATACVALGRDFARASLIASLSYTLQSLASGMIIQIDTMPAYVRWTRWITYTVKNSPSFPPDPKCHSIDRF